MAAGMISPIYDTEQARLQDQLATAAALRKQGLSQDIGQGYQGGKVYIVGNPLANVAAALGARYLDRNAREGLGRMEQQREQQRQDFLSAMPSPEETAPQFGPGQDGGSLPDVVRDKSPEQLADETRAWAAGAPRGMEGVQQFALQQAMTAPQRAAERRDTQQARQLEQAMRIEAAAKESQEKRDFQARQDELYRRTAAQQQGMLAAALAARGGGSNKPDMRIITTTDENGNPIQQAVDMNALKPGDRFGKVVPPGKGGGKLTPEQAKAAEVGHLEELIRRTAEAKNAPGLGTVTGPIAGRVPGVAYAGSPEASSALSTYEKYLEYLQTAGLEDLKAKGISPGSITEKEWPKFVARKTSLDRVKTTPEVRSELGRLQVDAYNTLAKVKGTGETYHDVGGSIFKLKPGADPKLKSSYEKVE